MNHNLYAVLMAGGVGSRFWPVSTPENPKQFHDMLGTGQSLLQKTFERLSKIIPQQNILILTNNRYENLVLEQLPFIDAAQILLEPAMRNTAPCILFAALKIFKKNPNALMVVAPSDHWIEDETAFISNLQLCFDHCQSNQSLLTLGIKPSFANTGFGYIEVAQNDHHLIKKVIRFCEKPNLETAEKFISEGNFLWNAGIFVWSVEAILEAFKNHQPLMYDQFHNGLPHYNTSSESLFLETAYPLSDNISIDYAILEKAQNVGLLMATFDWNDLGTWGSLHQKLDKDKQNNAIVNAVVWAKDASDNMISTTVGKTVIVNGLNDFIIVDRDNILLIYPKSKEQEIKAISQLPIFEKNHNHG